MPLLLQVLPLALGAAITPTLFALQVLVVSGPHWRARSSAVIAGSAAVFAVAITLGLVGLRQLPDFGTGTTDASVHVIELACGVVLLGSAGWLLVPHARDDARLARTVQHYADRASARVFLGTAAYLSVTDLSTFALLLPALHDVSRSADGLAVKAVAVAVLYLAVLLPVLVPPAAVVLLGDRARRPLQRVYTLVMDHQLQVMGGVALVFGVVLVWRGVAGLWGGLP